MHSSRSEGVRSGHGVKNGKQTKNMFTLARFLRLLFPRGHFTPQRKSRLAKAYIKKYSVCYTSFGR